METTEIKIGDKFFRYDENRRVYEKSASGKIVGSTFRGHFFEVTIVSETAKSWIDQWGVKISKKEPFAKLFTEEMISEAEWVKVHSYRIKEAIGYCRDASVLKEVAKLIGYEA